MKKYAIRIFLGLLLAILASTITQQSALAEPALLFEDVWIAEAPPVSKVMAAYMTIKNKSNQDVKIVSVQSLEFGAIEFHRTTNKEGMAGMQHQQSLIVPANGTLTLKQGDYHLMLFRPGRKFSAGDKATFIFNLDDKTAMSVIATVRKAASDHHSHHH